MKIKKHKWQFVKDTKNQKIDECTKCGIFREWVGGEYQTWYYTRCGQNKGSFHRPNCN